MMWGALEVAVLCVKAPRFLSSRCRVLQVNALFAMGSGLVPNVPRWFRNVWDQTGTFQIQKIRDGSGIFRDETGTFGTRPEPLKPDRNLWNQTRVFLTTTLERLYQGTFSRTRAKPERLFRYLHKINNIHCYSDYAALTMVDVNTFAYNVTFAINLLLHLSHSFAGNWPGKTTNPFATLVDQIVWNNWINKWRWTDRCYQRCSPRRFAMERVGPKRLLSIMPASGFSSAARLRVNVHKFFISLGDKRLFSESFLNSLRA